MPCAQGWVCQGFVQPARYLIFRTCMPVSGSSISGIEGSSTPSWGIGNGTHSWVLVSMAVSLTGFNSSDMVDHFLLAVTAPRVSGPTFHYRERPGRGSSLRACRATPLQHLGRAQADRGGHSLADHHGHARQCGWLLRPEAKCSHGLPAP